MREHMVLFITTFVLTLLAIFILIPVANRIGLVDKPHGRKQHVGAIPLIGGISVFTGVAITLSVFRPARRYALVLPAVRRHYCDPRRF